MSERKVLTKYYPPDFDPSAITRSRAPKRSGPKVQTVRLMAPFSMRCTACGEYIYKGRKFNARKETPEAERYLNIQIYRFYIRCTRCSAEITFRTDPKNQDYMVERGAKRSTEPWRRGLEGEIGESDEARLDRLEREAAEEGGAAGEERNAMAELEAKEAEARREMAVADALDNIRVRNARIERAAAAAAGPDALLQVDAGPLADERERQDREDEEAARRAFALARGRMEALGEEIMVEEEDDGWDGGDRGVDGSSGVAVAGPAEPSGTKVAVQSDVNTSVMGSSGEDGMKPPGNIKPTATAATAAAETPPPPAPPSFKRQVKKKKDRSALLGIKKKPSLV